ncbi:MAG: hypothetical protein MJ252_30805 [archaeon]|nr:hypothetical protein [archaeon]
MKNNLSAFLFFIFISSYYSLSPNGNTYDMYILALHWPNNTCFVYEDDTCEQRLSPIPQNNMGILYMITANTTTGETNPQCNNGTKIEINEEDFPDLFKIVEEYWPYPLQRFTEHDWHKYVYNNMGYCYSQYIKDMDYSKYFSKTMEIFAQNHLNELFINAFGTEHTGEVSYSYKEFLNKIDDVLGGRFYFVQCKIIGDKNYFEGLYITLDIDFKLFNFPFSFGNCDSSMPIYIKYSK